VHDPLVANLPRHWAGIVTRYDDPVEAAQGADALVVATEWPAYRNVPAAALAQRSGKLLVLDANRFLPLLTSLPRRLRYMAVGMPRPVE
jgi:UDPglucose 6-dehydrogenase